MSGRTRREVPADLAAGRDRFERWRRTRARGTRIPDHLWKVAVKLAATHGLARTASTLKLDYYALKKRVKADRNQQPQPATPAFVELPASPLPGSAECVIEWQDTAGASMRVHLKGHDVPDLLALNRQFWHGN